MCYFTGLRAKEGENLVLPCIVPATNLKDFTLIWRFNESSTVLTFDSSTSDHQVHKQWKDHVKYKTYQTAIELYNLNADTFNGQYSCEVFTTELRHLEQTSVSGIGKYRRSSDICMRHALNMSLMFLFCFYFYRAVFYFVYPCSFPSFSANSTAGIGVSAPFVVVDSAEALNSA